MGVHVRRFATLHACRPIPVLAIRCLSRGRGRRAGPNAADVAAAAFEQHHETAFGSRWAGLRAALGSPVEHVAWVNQYLPLPSVSSVIGAGGVRKDHSGGCMLWSRSASGSLAKPVLIPAAAATGVSLASHYALDGASPLPALRLAPRPGHATLDMCAAPGGKSLVLASQLFPPDEGAGARYGAGGSAERSLLVCNDRSGPRRGRLRGVLETHLPPHLLLGGGSVCGRSGRIEPGSHGVVVTGADAARWGVGSGPDAAGSATRRGGAFDRVLVDAPCSSERHFVGAVARRARAAAEWSPARLGRDAQLQLSILRRALRLLRAGGRVVYSTCSLSSVQNDAVVERLLSSPRDGADLQLADPVGGPLEEASIAPLLAGAERTRFGAQVLPDASPSGHGPLYWAVIERR